MPAITPASPPYSSKELRLAALRDVDVTLGEAGVSKTDHVWWFAAPGHRDLWVALGRSLSPAAAEGRALAAACDLRAVRRRAFLHGVPYRVLAAGPQPVAELQLLARDGMRDAIRRQLSAPTARIGRLRAHLLERALRTRSTTRP